jgi:tetratricopeptide (TPR) repeat protein
MQRLRRALGLAQSLPGEIKLRLKMQTAYAWSLTFSERLGPEVEDAWREGLRLAQEADSGDDQLRSLAGLSVLLSLTGRHRDALDTLNAFAATLEGEPDRSAGPDGERLRALTGFYRGDVRIAFRHLSALARSHGAVGGPSQAGRFEFDRYVATRTALATVAWVRGDTRAACDAAAAAVAGALSIDHVVSHSNALALAALPVALWTGDLDAAQSHVEALVDNLGQRDIGIWGPLSRFFAGAILSARGEVGGLEVMQIALEALVASNVLVRTPYYASMLAEVALGQGQMETARASLAIAHVHVERQDERWCLPEILRVEGLLVRQEGDFESAERTLLKAIVLARDIGAGAFELKAAAGLAEHWVEQGRVADAMALLESVCERFEPDAGGDGLARAQSLLAQWQDNQAA